MRDTTFVRQLMKLAGKSRIFTNKYENCRTVKCYRSPSAGDDSALIASMTTNLRAAGIEFTQIRTTKDSRWIRGAIIVRLPLTY